MKLQAASASGLAFIKPFWFGLIGPAWVVSLAFYAAVAAVRFFAFFSPYEMQHVYFLQSVAMWVLPFIFLTQSGRREIGISENAPSSSAMLLSGLAGVGCGLAFFGLGMELYGDSADNWCISIRNYLHIDDMRGILPPAGLFALYALPAIFLSPIGEELLFRGFIHQAFARRFNPATGTIVSSMLFGLIYLCVHGLSRDSSGFHMRFASAAIAVCLLACVGVVFTVCRTRFKSLWPAMAAHAAFNLTLLGATLLRFGS